MSKKEPIGKWRLFALAKSPYYIDNIGKIWAINNGTHFVANSADEFFYQRMWEYIDQNFALSARGGDCRRDFDARVKSLIGRKL